MLLGPTTMKEELEFLSSIPLHWFIKLGMAVLCGLIIGMERELRRKAAGIRTNIMICIGSTLYMLLSDLIMSGHAFGGDHTRIAGQVVVGMGFIGAGTIIQSRGHVMGLTSAATLWVVAAIGLVIGAGYPLFGLMVTLFVVSLLVGVGRMEWLLLGKCKMVAIQISFRDDPKTWLRIRELFEDSGKKMEELSSIKEKGICFMELSYCSAHPDHKDLLVDLFNIPDVRHAYHPTLGGEKK